MRSVLVCVRTPLAAQHLTSAAARLGLAGAVRTAVSDPEVMQDRLASLFQEAYAPICRVG